MPTDQYIAVTRCRSLEQNKVMRRFHKVLTGTPRATVDQQQRTCICIRYPLAKVEFREELPIRLRNFRPRPFEGSMTIFRVFFSNEFASAVFTLHSNSFIPAPKDCGDMLVLDKLNYFIWKWTITNKISQAIYAVHVLSI